MKKQNNVLVIEDDPDIADLIKFNLDKAGLDALILNEGRHIIHHIKQFKPDIILLDLMLPDVEGLDICKKVRQDKQFSHIPIIMVTAKGTESDRILGLELGADDYVVKPFSPRELILRIKAVLARSYKKEDEEISVISRGSIEMNLHKHEVKIHGSSLELTATEFKLLHELIANAGKVRTREILLDKVWGYSFEGYARTVDTHIRRLRKKIEPDSDLIETVRGIGYRFREL